MQLKDFLVRYAHRIGKRDIKALEKMPKAQVQNWMRVQKQKLGIQDEDVKDEVIQVRSKANELMSEIVETVVKEKLFKKIIQKTLSDFNDWDLVKQELKIYSDFVKDTGLKDHVNQCWLEVKRGV